MLSLIEKLIDRLDKPAIDNRLLLGQILSQQVRSKQRVKDLSEVEFKVFSEHREDGIIQYLCHRVPIKNKVFIEFGVGDYRESNTRFLLMNDDWKGLVIEATKKHVSRIRSLDFYWRKNLTAIQSFVTKENVNDLFTTQGFTGDIGLLSIDIDGNDYWIWDAIVAIQPRIVVCEYNSVFGMNNAITIPYEAQFDRTQAHYSNLYFGASLKALCTLAEKKKYRFAGSDSSGTNAFFVRNDVAQNIARCTCEGGYVESGARESRDEHGRLTFVSGKDRLKLIANMKVVDVLSQKEMYLKELA
ncbi:MAG: hypothetical protein HY562_11490 [Ignavibacteriales bacterium]|nr:hypothetical protein [Ignavibacteriales bacterium]